MARVAHREPSIFAITLVLGLIALAGCQQDAAREVEDVAGAPPASAVIQVFEPGLPAGSVSKPGYVEVTTYYGTDREPGDLSPSMPAVTQAANRYSGRRAKLGELRFGEAKVSIPFIHQIGELEERFLRRDDPTASVVLLNVNERARADWVGELRRQLQASNASAALIYVHGYNVDFREAARRCAQLAYDLQFSGVPMFFSWPSRGITTAYPVDEATVEWSTPHLAEFLRTAIVESDVQNVFIIAHSMGARATSRALEALTRTNPSMMARIRAVIFAAPDIDADVFQAEILPAFSAATRVTLYASNEDDAIKASTFLHDYPRAGGVGVATPNVISIDASNVDTSFIGHSYYGDSKIVIKDIAELMRGLAPDARSGIQRHGSIWRFKDAAP